MKYRVRYWNPVNEYYGEWILTGLMNEKTAQSIAENLRLTFNNVKVIKDEYEN